MRNNFESATSLVIEAYMYANTPGFIVDHLIEIPAEYLPDYQEAVSTIRHYSSQRINSESEAILCLLSLASIIKSNNEVPDTRGSVLSKRIRWWDEIVSIAIAEQKSCTYTSTTCKLTIQETDHAISASAPNNIKELSCR